MEPRELLLPPAAPARYTKPTYLRALITSFQLDFHAWQKAQNCSSSRRSKQGAEAYQFTICTLRARPRNVGNTGLRIHMFRRFSEHLYQFRVLSPIAWLPTALHLLADSSYSTFIFKSGSGLPRRLDSVQVPSTCHQSSSNRRVIRKPTHFFQYWACRLPRLSRVAKAFWLEAMLGC
jgi:hypothetical protein